MTRRTLLLCALGTAAPVLSHGQVAVSVRAGLIHHIEGRVWAGGAPLDPDSLKLRQLGTGESLETRRGRAELVLGPSQFTRLSQYSKMTLLSGEIAAPELAIESGSAIVSWRVFEKGEPVTVRTGGESVTILKPGVYRFDVAEGGVSRLRVFEGKAHFGESRSVSARREITLDEGASPAKFDPDEADVFDRWSARRDRVVGRQARSGRRRGGRGPGRGGMPSASERGPRRSPRIGRPRRF